MSVAIGIVLAALAGVFVAWPLLRPNAAEEEKTAGPVENVALERLEHDKREAYAAIRDAEMDYHIGKLSEADLYLIRTKYETQALAAIASIEAAKSREKAAPAAAPTAGFCPSCGTALPAQAKFCPACGGSRSASVDRNARHPRQVGHDAVDADRQ
ncbi:MAG TPA: zinc ribbon domain-containing protein [Terriglobales bacterium]|nr:zinc ribbon domain-containing protein [Terriglobales bacterium]